MSRYNLAWLAVAWLVAMATAKAEAASPTASFELVAAAAERRDLAEQPDWRALLLVSPGADRAVSSPAFYLSDADAWTPRLELRATLANLLAEPSIQHGDTAEDTLPSCRFPARRAWLSRYLPELLLPPPPHCPALTAFRQRLNAASVSWVFSSYFAGNPSSLFGHVFLVFHQARVPGQVSSPMLDWAVDFSANPTTENPLLYVVLGLTGGFPGRFARMPLYLKIQQYNNAESRDLWDYELALTSEELESLENVLWEVGPYDIPYRYFTQNCASVLLALMRAGLPTKRFEALHAWTIPADALRSLVLVPGLVSQVTYRPSALARFRQSYQSLTEAEQHAVEQLVANQAPESINGALASLSPKEQAQTAEAAIAFIDYSERLAGSETPQFYGSLRRELLLRRAVLPAAASASSASPPAAEMPHRAGGTARIGVGTGYSSILGGLTQLNWRPVLHDVKEPTAGYGDGLGLSISDLVAGYSARFRRAYVESWDLLAIRSLPSLEAVLAPLAWELAVGVDNHELCHAWPKGCYASRLRVGLGPSGLIAGATAYALAGAEFGAAAGMQQPVYAAPRLTGGLLIPASQHMKFSFEIFAQRAFAPQAVIRDDGAGKVVATLLPTEGFEASVALCRRFADSPGYRGQDTSAVLTLAHFY